MGSIVPHPAYGTTNNNIGPGLTRFTYAPAIHMDWVATEAERQVVWRHDATISKISVSIDTNSVNENSVVTLRVNGADGNGTLTVPGLTDGYFEDTVNSDSISAGDKVCFQVVTGATGTLWKCSSTSLASEATGANSLGIIGVHPISGFNADNTTFYLPLSGYATPNTTALAEIPVNVKTACTLKHLQVNVPASSRNGTTTVKTYINGADGAQSITIPALTTGWFEDTTNSDSISVDDDVSFKAVTVTGGGNCLPTSITVAFETTDGSALFAVCASPGVAIPLAAGATHYSSLGGSLPNSNNEGAMQQSAKVDSTFSKLELNVTENTVSSNSTFKFRVNAANGNQSITIPSATTGTFEDSSNTDAVLADDLLTFQLVAGAGGTSIKVSNYFVKRNALALASGGHANLWRWIN